MRTLTFTTQAAANAAKASMEARIQAFCTAAGHTVDGSGYVSPKKASTGVVDAAGQKTTSFATVSGSGSSWSFQHPEYHTLRRRLLAGVGRNFIAYALQDLTPVLAGSTTTYDPNDGTAGGWVKFSNTFVPPLGAGITYFDPWVIKDGSILKMWVSNRDTHAIAYCTSSDGGQSWTTPIDVLGAVGPAESDANRACVVKMGPSDYRMWFTGQKTTFQWISYATSPDGINWTRYASNPVMTALPSTWESRIDSAISQPVVIWDAGVSLFKMWYSGGASYEPERIGYATSPDGFTWTRNGGNPIFAADATMSWEAAFVGVGHVWKADGYYYMAYIAYENSNLATICLARSVDGITNWERHALNPIIRKSTVPTDQDYWGVYRPTVVLDGTDYKLFYNGRNDDFATGKEAIMMATLSGSNLWF
jgi:predicted GH43/DUF377 family glycosyl hydrolase